MDLENTAIERLRMAEQMSLRYYDKPLLVTYSGGKDSDVCLELARRAGIQYEVQHSLTTADAPETIRHVKARFGELELQGVRCTIIHPTYKGHRVSMWSLIPQKLMPPTRAVRYCCQVLKEGAGKNRAITTGVRWAESTKRSKRGVLEAAHKDISKRVIITEDNTEDRRLIERCQLQAKIVCNPIIDWSDRDVWQYLRDTKCQANPLYDEGLTRVGCVGCPMAGIRRYTEFRRWPEYEQMYRHAFARMMEARQARGLQTGLWRTVVDVWDWWMEDRNLDGQLSLFGDEEI